MKYISLLRRRRLVASVLVLSGVAVVSMALWQAAALSFKGARPSATQPSPEKIKQAFHENIRRGIGNSVKLAGANANAGEAKAAVESANAFIKERAGLSMSEETAARLATLEQKALARSGRRISVEEVSDTLTDLIVERVAALTDMQIDALGRAISPNSHDALLRANGDHRLPLEQFVIQARAFRDQSRQGNSATREVLRSFVREEVEDRVSNLSEALPDQFGNAQTKGLTPLQAVLIIYSVTADDSLAGSLEDLQKAASRNPENATQKVRKTIQSANLFGVHGQLFSSPVNLIFNKEAISSLFNRLEKGGNVK